MTDPFETTRGDLDEAFQFCTHEEVAISCPQPSIPRGLVPEVRKWVHAMDVLKCRFSRFDAMQQLPPGLPVQHVTREGQRPQRASAPRLEVGPDGRERKALWRDLGEDTDARQGTQQAVQRTRMGADGLR